MKHALCDQQQLKSQNLYKVLWKQEILKIKGLTTPALSTPLAPKSRKSWMLMIVVAEVQKA